MILTRLAEELNNLSKHASDGVLVLHKHTVVWNLHLSDGKLTYVTSEVHPVRRWNRALKQHCPNWNWGVEPLQLSGDQPWECHLLVQGISQRQLSAIQAKLVIRTIVQECFFELSSHTDFESNWKPSKTDILHVPSLVALSSREILSVLAQATNARQKWQAAGLGHLSPTLAPVLKPTVDFQELPVLEKKYFKNKFALWDIALEQEKSVTELTLSLIPWFEKGVLEFQNIPDLPLPNVKQTVVTTYPLSESKPVTSVQKQPLIACIDDSPVLAYTLRKILMPSGYQMLSIPEPMRGFSQLIEHKPDLILLDLLLPNADGYSICKFLRDTPVFRNTPIIILTERNTQIDRARAMSVGATEFLGKPPQSQELLQMVHKYLKQQSYPN
ncbi:response regulator [Fischerella sp. PCC 9605]|uniref:response regulator n=1 Tax=Fischerella sp. PCC 9605 TaxID=1173024 RepID=UPI00047C3F86|nr:response regulator [Fischerella sp. PCC 9605]